MRFLIAIMAVFAGLAVAVPAAVNLGQMEDIAVDPNAALHPILEPRKCENGGSAC